MIDAVAALWGFAEATLFFLVPDVFLTYVAIRSLRRALRATLFATAGALLGGAAMVAFAAAQPAPARHLLLVIPGIHSSLLASVAAQLDAHGLGALFLGPLRGTPYKIYAVEWGSRHRLLLPFALATVPARAIRFILTAALTAPIARLLRPKVQERTLVAIHLVAWTLFYTLYFVAMR